MLAVRELRSLFFAAIVTMNILLLQTVSSIDNNNAGRYRRFLTSNEDGLHSKRNPEFTPRRSEILTAIVDQILAEYLTDKGLLYVIIENGMEYNGFKDLTDVGSTSVIGMVPDDRNFDMPHIVYQKPAGYLFLGTDLSEMIKPLMTFTTTASSWNPRGLYITIARSKEEAVSVITILREKLVYKVVVLVIHNDPLDPLIEAYTWRPYHPLGNCGPPTQESLVRLGTMTGTLNFKNETNIQPGMMPKNFGNCPLNVSFMIWEPYVFSPEEEKINQITSLEVVLIELVCSTIGVRVNRRYRLNISEIMKSEAMAGAMMASSESLEMFDVSVSYIQDSLGWIVPRKNERRTLFMLNQGSLLTFGTLAVIAMCVAAGSLMAAGSRHWALSVWESLWEQSHSEVPKKVRGIWCCWLLVCLHWSSVYRTALVNNFANPFVENVIHDESELIESGLKLGFLVAAEMYFDRENELERKILEQYVPCKSVPECYKEIPTGRAVFTNKMLTKYLNGRKDVPNSLLEIVRHLPPSLTYKLSMNYAKGHAMYPAFNECMVRAIESGFVEYWLERIDVAQTSIIMRKSHSVTGNRYLTFYDVRRAFDMLAIGLSIAGASFFCEIFARFFKRYVYIK